MPSGLNVVIDLSHHNQTVDFAQVKGAGILGVIHKATQGVAFVDPTYADRRALASRAGLLWGAYHFGTASDGVQQAQAFLKAVGDPTNLLLVLDFENNMTGPSMTLEEARAFVTHVQQATNRYPAFYCGQYFKELMGTGTDPILAQCPLWLAQYGPTAVVPPNWPTWTLWQYTDGAQGDGPYEVAGVGRVDRDVYNGSSAADLQKLWTGS
ncbi:MAG TPA: glycoside hydrolase family 25 protein [Burkholderiaceae bacterium]|nr:glycoside hydrolase family 25 protein [Burkholderiaceae bacterium]